MAKCENCGKKLNIFTSEKNRCPDCADLLRIELRKKNEERRQRLKEEARLEELKVAQIQAITLTTESAPNIKIVRRIEIVTAECAFGMNIFKDLFASVRDIVGGRSKAVQDTMRDARRTALHELKAEAHLVGANAVVGVDLDYVELSAVGDMVLLVASGTAVVMEDD